MRLPHSDSLADIEARSRVIQARNSNVGNGNDAIGMSNHDMGNGNDVRHEQVERDREHASHIRAARGVRDNPSAPALTAERSPFASSSSGHNAPNPVASHDQWVSDQAGRAITSEYDAEDDDDDDEVMELKSFGPPVD